MQTAPVGTGWDSRGLACQSEGELLEDLGENGSPHWFFSIGPEGRGAGEDIGATQPVQLCRQEQKLVIEYLLVNFLRVMVHAGADPRLGKQWSTGNLG